LQQHKAIATPLTSILIRHRPIHSGDPHVTGLDPVMDCPNKSGNDEKGTASISL
jgi:hypothetical protein